MIVCVFVWRTGLLTLFLDFFHRWSSRNYTCLLLACTWLSNNWVGLCVINAGVSVIRWRAVISRSSEQQSSYIAEIVPSSQHFVIPVHPSLAHRPIDWSNGQRASQSPGGDWERHPELRLRQTQARSDEREEPSAKLRELVLYAFVVWLVKPTMKTDFSIK